MACLISESQCWKITRTDGVVLGFTTHDEVIEFEEVEYFPCESLLASAVTSTSTASTDSGDIQARGILSDDALSPLDLAAGLYDGATVEVWAVPWGDSEGEPARRLSKGIVAEVSQRSSDYVLTILTAGARLYQQALLPTYTPACRWEFGGVECGVDTYPITESGTVTATEAPDLRTRSTYRRFQDTSRTEEEGYFNFGTLTWVTGENAGIRARIKGFAEGVFDFWNIMPHQIQVGDEYVVYPGCNKLEATCKEKYDNFLRFGGFPDLPGIDAIAQTPNAKG